MTSLLRPATNRWWPPATPDFGAYADAGFNLALTENALAGLCQRKAQASPNATVTRGELTLTLTLIPTLTPTQRKGPNTTAQRALQP